MSPKFLYFDLGKVIVNFSVEQMLGQVAAVSGITTDAVREAVFASGLMQRHETGQITVNELYEGFCTATGTRPDRDQLVAAAADIFDLNLPMLPLVAQLQQAGYPMGILSNTCELHWRQCFGNYRIIVEGFQVYALSHHIGALKPEEKIYRAAAELAGYAPEEIFFVDDIAGHVEGAKAIGFDAIQFTGAPALAAELRQRGLQFNY
ncbi:MAG: HAD family phosphatase [Planctomycetaceae bacterium]|nr:HAD family phosphatase [Planctomycetaceae bacterium]